VHGESTASRGSMIDLDASTTQAVAPIAPSSLAEHLARLNQTVAAPDLEDMTSDLEQESDELAQDQIDALFEN